MPESYLKAIKVAGLGIILNIKNAASGCRTTNLKPILCSNGWKGWTFNGNKFNQVEQDPLT